MYAAFTPQQAKQTKETWDWREIHPCYLMSINVSIYLEIGHFIVNYCQYKLTGIIPVLIFSVSSLLEMLTHGINYCCLLYTSTLLPVFKSKIRYQDWHRKEGKMTCGKSIPPQMLQTDIIRVDFPKPVSYTHL